MELDIRVWHPETLAPSEFNTPPYFSVHWAVTKSWQNAQTLYVKLTRSATIWSLTSQQTGSLKPEKELSLGPYTS